MVRYRSSAALISPWRVRVAWPHSAQCQQRVDPAATGLHAMLAVCAHCWCATSGGLSRYKFACDGLLRSEPLWCTAAEVGRARTGLVHAAEHERENVSNKTHLLRESQGL